jgi:2,3-bisphosphoglycerate-independent phosphoglycerate mutase
MKTVEDVLADTAVGCGFHDFAVEGGTIRVTTQKLRAALEAAYDETNPNWVVFVDIEEGDEIEEDDDLRI